MSLHALCHHGAEARCLMQQRHVTRPCAVAQERPGPRLGAHARTRAPGGPRRRWLGVVGVVYMRVASCYNICTKPRVQINHEINFNRVDEKATRSRPGARAWRCGARAGSGERGSGVICITLFGNSLKTK